MNNCPKCGKPGLTIGTLHFFKCCGIVDGGTLAWPTSSASVQGNDAKSEVEATQSLPTINPLMSSWPIIGHLHTHRSTTIDSEGVCAFCHNKQSRYRIRI